MMFPVAIMLLAGMLLYSGVHNQSITDTLRALLGRAPTGKLGSLSGAPTGGSSNASTPSGGSTTSSGAPISSGGNPFPGGWQPSRLDMGYDGTFKGQIASPVDGVVTYMNPHDSGWEGGGYVAIKSNGPLGNLPSRTLYFAEGIVPTVKQGQKVKQGQQIASPIPNPYNGITGNIEWGLADDTVPQQPLAHVISNPSHMVLEFSHWVQTALGVAPPATTDHAGFP